VGYGTGEALAKTRRDSPALYLATFAVLSTCQQSSAVAEKAREASYCLEMLCINNAKSCLVVSFVKFKFKFKFTIRNLTIFILFLILTLSDLQRMF